MTSQAPHTRKCQVAEIPSPWSPPAQCRLWVPLGSTSSDLTPRPLHPAFEASAIQPFFLNFTHPLLQPGCHP